MANANISRVTTTFYEFTMFYHIKCSSETYEKYRKVTPRCFGCGFHISEFIVVGIAVHGGNQIFCQHCAKELAEKYKTPFIESEG
jgi:hypothetical protein